MSLKNKVKGNYIYDTLCVIMCISNIKFSYFYLNFIQ